MNGIIAWEETIKNLDIKRIDEDCLTGLHLLLTLDSFNSIHSLVKDKIKDISDYTNDKHKRELLKQEQETATLNKLKAAEIDKAEVNIQIKKGSTASIRKLTIGALIDLHKFNLDKEVLVVPMDMTGQMLKPVKMTIKQLIQEISMAMPVPRKDL